MSLPYLPFLTPPIVKWVFPIALVVINFDATLVQRGPTLYLPTFAVMTVHHTLGWLLDGSLVLSDLYLMVFGLSFEASLMYMCFYCYEYLKNVCVLLNDIF